MTTLRFKIKDKKRSFFFFDNTSFNKISWKSINLKRMRKSVANAILASMDAGIIEPDTTRDEAKKALLSVGTASVFVGPTFPYEEDLNVSGLKELSFGKRYRLETNTSNIFSLGSPPPDGETGFLQFTLISRGDNSQIFPAIDYWFGDGEPEYRDGEIVEVNIIATNKNEEILYWGTSTVGVASV